MAGVQILVVEDNNMQSKLVSFLLQEAGHTVQIAGSAEEALERLRSFSPDLILMDLDLPGMDGLQLTRVLRFDPVQATTPIIALTAYTDPSDLERAREAGCDGKISKPIDTAAFARLVGHYMGLTTDVHTDVPCDSHDLLAEIRNNFLAEGLEQCSRILKDLKSGPGCAIEVIQRVLHRWAGLAGTLGFPEISDQARKLELLLTSTSPSYSEIEQAIEIARRRFSSAARNRPKLPLELITGLMGVRIGLVNFSEEEAKRLRTAAYHDNVQVVIEQLKSEPIEKQTGYGALVINECAISAQADLHRLKLSIPAVFIRSRSSLQSLSKLPAHAYDFLIAPWDAQEVLIRVYRLIAKTAPSQPAAGSPNTKNSRPRILIVDDDPDLVAIVSETLHQFEMDCDIARNGEQALDAVHRRPPDAIILDVNLLDLDGFEVLKRLRRNLITKEIPVLLLTARGQESDIARGFGSGADDYVVKPFKRLNLVKRVDSMLSARRRPWPPR
jgi:two-component system cell cycle response regulator DivK